MPSHRETVREVRLHDPARHTLNPDHDVVWCGECGARWCDVCHPTPSARCAFEYEHGPTLFVGRLALYRGIRGSVKVRVTGITTDGLGHDEVRVVVTSRTDPVYRQHDVLHTSPVWLTSRQGRPFAKVERTTR